MRGCNVDLAAKFQSLSILQVLFASALAVFGVLAKFAIDAWVAGRLRAFWRRIFFAIAPALLLIGYVFLVSDMGMTAKSVSLGIVGAVLGGALGVAIAQFWGVVKINSNTEQEAAMTEKPNSGAPSVKVSGTNNVVSVGQSGGITANQVFVGPQRLQFTPELGEALKREIPQGHLLMMTVVGGNIDQSVGKEISEYLRESGYNIQIGIVGTMSPPPERKISIQRGDGVTFLTVAPSAH